MKNLLLYIDGEERAGRVALTVPLVSCNCQCSVVLPRGTVDWFAVCDWGNS